MRARSRCAGPAAWLRDHVDAGDGRDHGERNEQCHSGQRGKWKSILFIGGAVSALLAGGVEGDDFFEFHGVDLAHLALEDLAAGGDENGVGEAAGPLGVQALARASMSLLSKIRFRAATCLSCKTARALDWRPGASALMVTSSKLPLRYMRFMVTNSGSSARQGPHEVAQTLIRSILGVLLETRVLMAGALTDCRVTGSFSMASSSRAAAGAFFGPFNGTAKGAGFGDGNGLAREEGIQGVAGVVFGDGGGGFPNRRFARRIGACGPGRR